MEYSTWARGKSKDEDHNSNSSSLASIEAFSGVETTAKVESTGTWQLELELIQTQMAQKPMLRAEVGMRVRCANKASAE